MFPRNKNKRELNRRLVGATLGDEEESVDDARTWIKRSKKKEKELAAKRQAELDAQDALVPESYTESKHLHSVYHPRNNLTLLLQMT